jgi:hypothetical protein
MFTHTFSYLVSYSPVVAYLGPSTVLPVASVLAAVFGVVLMFGRYILGMVNKALHRGVPVSAATENAEKEQG